VGRVQEKKSRWKLTVAERLWRESLEIPMANDQEGGASLEPGRGEEKNKEKKSIKILGDFFTSIPLSCFAILCSPSHSYDLNSSKRIHRREEAPNDSLQPCPRPFFQVLELHSSLQPSNSPSLLNLFRITRQTRLHCISFNLVRLIHHFFVSLLLLFLHLAHF